MVLPAKTGFREAGEHCYLGREVPGILEGEADSGCRLQGLVVRAQAGPRAGDGGGVCVPLRVGQS